MAKIGSYTPKNGRVEGIKIFKPIQTLLVNVLVDSAHQQCPKGILKYIENKMKVNVTLQNSDNGHLTTLVPYIEIGKLADISTYNEGYSVVNDSSILYPVMLSVDQNLSVDNDKYLEVSFLDIPSYVHTINLNSFEVGELSDFVAYYSKMTAPAGVARYQINTNDSEFLSLPVTGFDEIQIKHINGVVSVLDKTDLDYLMAQNNDITAVLQEKSGLSFTGRFSDHDVMTLQTADEFVEKIKQGKLDIYGSGNIYLSRAESYVLNLKNVDTLEIIRDTDCKDSFEFILGDFVDSKKPVEKSKK